MDMMTIAEKPNITTNIGIWEDKKVLVINADPCNADLIRPLFTKGRMEMVTAANGVNAIARLREHPDIALVLVDITERDLVGYEAITQIRNQEKYDGVPIVIITREKHDLVKYYKAGAADYLIVPITEEKLFAVIKVLLTPLF